VLDTLLMPGEERHSIVRIDGQLNKDAVKCFALREDAFMENMVTHFNLTCGVPPREFQMKTLLYDSLCEGSLKWRNMYLLHNRLAIGNPDGKRMTMQELGECLWLCTQMSTRSVTFWIAIMRPTITHLLTLADEDVHFRDTHIFIWAFPRVRKEDTHVISGQDVNKIMQKRCKTLPVRVTCNLLRQIFTTMFGLLFPKTRGTNGGEEMAPTSSVMQQGQHTLPVGVTHYERSDNVPPALNMSITKARSHMMLSLGQQAVLGLNPMAEGISGEELLSVSPAFRLRRYGRLALLAARSLIVVHYGLGGRDRAQVQETVRDIFARCPYICGDGVSVFFFTFSMVKQTENSLLWKGPLNIRRASTTAGGRRGSHWDHADVNVR
jgi:hypothetical protein